MKVKATQLGYYGLKRRREGDVFEIKPEAFSHKWMVKLDMKAVKAAGKKREEVIESDEELSSGDSEVI